MLKHPTRKCHIYNVKVANDARIRAINAKTRSAKFEMDASWPYQNASPFLSGFSPCLLSRAPGFREIIIPLE